MKEVNSLLIVPYSPATPVFLSDEFIKIVGRLCSLDFDGIVFPFYIDGYIKDYAGLYISGGNVKTLFGGGFLKDILRLELSEGYVEFVLFPYIYMDRNVHEDKLVVYIDDEECASKMGENVLFIPRNYESTLQLSSTFAEFHRKCEKDIKICVQSLEKLLKYV